MTRWQRRGVKRLGDGRVRITIADAEEAVLASLPPQLLAIIEGDADTDLAEGVRRRLFPPAHDDPELEAGYRDLVGDDLEDHHRTALHTFAETLEEGRSDGSLWTVELDADQAAAWLSVINDARLTLAQAVGIETEADWERSIDSDDAAAALLHYLGWLEEELVTALLSSLDG